MEILIMPRVPRLTPISWPRLNDAEAAAVYGFVVNARWAALLQSAQRVEGRTQPLVREVRFPEPRREFLDA
jgi:hypothetical protein